MATKFFPYMHEKPRYSTRIDEDDWRKHENRIREMHQAKQPRSVILQNIIEDGFNPSMSQLDARMKKWKLEVYKTRLGNCSNASRSESGRRNRSENGHSSLLPVAEASDQCVYNKDNFLPVHTRTLGSKSASDTTSISSFLSTGRSSRTSYSISSASSILQDDLSPDAEPDMKEVQIEIAYTKPRPSSPDSHHRDRPLARDRQTRPSAVRQDSVMNGPVADTGTASVETSNEAQFLPKMSRIIDSEADLSLETMKAISLSRMDSYKNGSPLRPLDTLMMVTIADCLYASEYYQDAFDHYYFLANRIMADPTASLNSRFKAVCNCARTYVTQQQADTVLSLLGSCLGLLESEDFLAQASKLAVLHSFLAEFECKDRASEYYHRRSELRNEDGVPVELEVKRSLLYHNTHAETANSIMEQSSPLIFYKDHIIVGQDHHFEPFREKLAMANRLQKLSRSSNLNIKRGTHIDEDARTAALIVTEGANLIGSELFKWCSNFITRNTAKINEEVTKTDIAISESGFFQSFFCILMQAWFSDHSRQDFSGDIACHDPRTLFASSGSIWRTLSEFDALAAMANVILTHVRSIVSDYLPGGLPFPGVLLYAITDPALRDSAPPLFDLAFMSCIATTWQERQGSKKLSELELWRSFITPLVSSDLLKRYLTKWTLPGQADRKDGKDAKKPRVLHVQFAPDEPDPADSRQRPDAYLETLAGSPHSSTNSSFRRFKRLSVRLKHEGGACSVISTPSSKSTSSGAMSIDSNGSRKSNSIFQMSVNDSMPDIHKEHGEPHYHGPHRLPDPYRRHRPDESSIYEHINFPRNNVPGNSRTYEIDSRSSNSARPTHPGLTHLKIDESSPASTRHGPSYVPASLRRAERLESPEVTRYGPHIAYDSNLPMHARRGMGLKMPGEQPGPPSVEPLLRDHGRRLPPDDPFAERESDLKEREWAVAMRQWQLDEEERLGGLLRSADMYYC